MVRALYLSIGLGLLAFVTAFTPQGADEKPVRSDVQYIRCGVCEALAKNAYEQIKTLRDVHKKPGKLSEFEILEKVEKMIDPVAEEGEWITKLDLVERGSELVLEEHSKPGVCGAKCKTIARAAEEILGDHDTDLGEILWKGDSSLAGVSNWLCKEVTDSCTREPPPLPRGRKPGVPFKEVDPEELNMQRMMAAMQGNGMRSSMYSRDEAAKMAGAGSNGSGDDSDEEDEEGEDATAAGGGGSSTAMGKMLSNLQGTLTGAAHAARDAAGPLVDKALPVLGKARDGLASVFKSVTDKVSPSKQVQPPHVEL